MNTKLFKSVTKLKKSNTPKRLYGILGAHINGKQRVEVQTRPGFVYVRLRSTTNELIQAFNGVVANLYDLPVILERQGNRYVIVDRDTQKYSTWKSNYPFTSYHGDSHSWNNAGGGNDIVWVYGRQIADMIGMPTDEGSDNILIGTYTVAKSDGTWIRVGGTGTSSFLPYVPDGNAVMGLVYLDTVTGNPGILINSGTSMPEGVTGTYDVIPYLPVVPNSAYMPIAGVRIVSGTSSIGWSNIYDVRQLYGGFSTSSPIPPLDGDRVVVTNSSGTLTTYPNLQYDSTNNNVLWGDGTENNIVSATNSLLGTADGSSPSVTMTTYGTSTAPFFAGIAAGGTAASPSAVLANRVLARFRGRGYDGTNISNTQSEMRFIADGDWSSTSHPTRIEFYTTPTGTSTLSLASTINSDGSYTTRGRRQNVTIHSGTYTQVPSDEVIVFDGDGLIYNLLPALGTHRTIRVVCRNGDVTLTAIGDDVIKGWPSQILYSGEDLIITDTEIGVWE